MSNQTFLEFIGAKNRVPNGFWKDIENHKIYIEWLKYLIKYNTMEDWYKISKKLLRNNNGGALLNYYKGSVTRLLKKFFPQYDWLEWKFIIPLKNFWKDKKNHKRYIIWLGKELGYTTMEDWYKISTKYFVDNYGGGLLVTEYENSYINCIISVFPDYKWLEWKFNIAPQKFWNNKENHKRYLLWLGKELGCTTMEDWYKISQQDFINNYGTTVIHFYKQYYQLIIDTFPEYEWDISKFNNLKTEGKMHDWLIKNTKKLFIKIITQGYRPKWANLRKTHNTYYIFDIYIELINGVKIIIEIDGEQHYRRVSNWNIPLHNQIRDEIKQRLAGKNQHNLIRVNQEDIWLDKNNWENDIIEFINEKYENDDEIEIYNCADGERYYK